jgi:NDP-sugar pyrophosphorylase family protein
VGYKDERVREHFGDGSKWNVKIKYVTQSLSNVFPEMGLGGNIQVS